MAAGYLALVWEDEAGTYRVAIPDVPECGVAAGDTVKAALGNAAAAILEHLGRLAMEGQPWPAPRSIEAIRRDPTLADELEHAIVSFVSLGPPRH